MQQIMITGSNRGIGLALVKEFLKIGDCHIFAACRNPEGASDLKDLQSQNPEVLTIVELDINDDASITSAVQAVSAKTSQLDLLINNAGIYPKTPGNIQFGQLDRDEVSYVLSTNAVSPVMVTQSFVDLLRAGDNPRVMMISTQMASITRAGSSGFSYRVSKTALNMAMKVLSLMLSGEGITVVSAHPGWVQTDMGGSSATLTPGQSASGLVTVAQSLTQDQTGMFFNYDGTEMPW